MERAVLGVQEMDKDIEDFKEEWKNEVKEEVDYNITVRIAVYSTKGEFIKQCDSSVFSDETIKSIMDDIGREMDNG